MFKFLKSLVFPTSYCERLKSLHNRFLEETEKDKLLASFAEFLLPLHHYFSKNCVEDKWVVVDKDQFKKVYEMGVKFYMGMKIYYC